MIQALTTMCAYAIVVTGFVAIICGLCYFLFWLIKVTAQMVIEHIGINKIIIEFARDKFKYQRLLKELEETP